MAPAVQGRKLRFCMSSLRVLAACLLTVACVPCKQACARGRQASLAGQCMARAALHACPSTARSVAVHHDDCAAPTCVHINMHTKHIWLAAMPGGRALTAATYRHALGAACRRRPLVDAKMSALASSSLAAPLTTTPPSHTSYQCARPGAQERSGRRRGHVLPLAGGGAGPAGPRGGSCTDPGG